MQRFVENKFARGMFGLFRKTFLDGEGSYQAAQKQKSCSYHTLDFSSVLEASMSPGSLWKANKAEKRLKDG